jgi:sigma-B regulation protein RsbU (phosphoserine phosphatase)
MTRLREWLRRMMPRVALAAVALYVLRLLIRDTSAYRNTPLGLIGFLTFCAVAATVLYYGLKLLVRIKRYLLWRVRRRLIITYLFVGMTPIVLLLLLGALAATGGSTQAMVRVVTVEIGATERQTLEGARTLADALVALPSNASERAAQDWLDERAALLRSTLPGARISVWRGAAENTDAHNLDADAHSLGSSALPQLASASVDEETRGVGFDNGEERAPLPAWLEGSEEWSGFAYTLPPEEARSAFGTPSVRALVRRGSGARAVAVLITVPVSRALIKRYRENTGINVRPFFLGASSVEGNEESGGVRVKTTEESRGVRLKFGDAESDNAARPAEKTEEKDRVVDFRRDQFGEPMPEVSTLNFPYPVILPATEWQTGRQAKPVAFMVDWSWAEGGKQFWGDAALGPAWSRALYVIAVMFLVLEILALFSAAWMTRAVTGTVHKLYRATEFIKRGDFSHRIRTRSRDQLGELTVAFNDMSADIESLLAERVEHERLKREIEIAHEVQSQLFPRSTPALKSAEITGECRAAMGVAGDYYDFVEAAPGLVAFALGDVSGKGLSASLVMSNLQAALRAQVSIIAERQRLAARGASALAGEQATAAAASADTSQALEAQRSATAEGERRVVAGMTESINQQLCSSTDTNRFATLFLALYDDRTRTLRYTNAGHNEPALVRADGHIERLSTGGTVVGAFGFTKYEEAQTTLGDGDVLVLFSDGLSEAQNSTGEEFSDARLAQFAASHRTETANNLRQSIFDEVDGWSGAIERGDDQTLVILKAVNRES